MSARRKLETKDGYHTIKTDHETYNRLYSEKGAHETWKEMFERLLKR